MSGIHCTICDKIVESIDYDLKKSITLHSKTVLLNLLQIFVEDISIITNPTPTSRTNYLICRVCYFLLNQLDNLQVRVKNIENELKSYLENRQKHIQQQLEEQTTTTTATITTTTETNRFLKDINLSLKNEESVVDTNKVIATTTTTINLKPYECNETTTTWQTLNELKKDQPHPYICEICGQNYKRKQALIIHVGMHNGLNQFQCKYCMKSFTQKGGLIRHLPIHTGEMPYQCDICGKRFIHHTSFNIHRTSHTGEKTHKCNICGLLLMSVSHLKRHTRVHTGEKRFSCTQCGRKFAERYNLVVHEKTIHSTDVTNTTTPHDNKKKFKCQICNKFYSRQAKLAQHLLYSHQKIYNNNE